MTLNQHFNCHLSAIWLVSTGVSWSFGVYYGECPVFCVSHCVIPDAKTGSIKADAPVTSSHSWCWAGNQPLVVHLAARRQPLPRKGPVPNLLQIVPLSHTWTRLQFQPLPPRLSTRWNPVACFSSQLLFKHGPEGSPPNTDMTTCQARTQTAIPIKKWLGLFRALWPSCWKVTSHCLHRTMDRCLLGFRCFILRKRSTGGPQTAKIHGHNQKTLNKVRVALVQPLWCGISQTPPDVGGLGMGFH